MVAGLKTAPQQTPIFLADAIFAEWFPARRCAMLPAGIEFRKTAEGLSERGSIDDDFAGTGG
jgi:hypothetical protein